MYKTLRAFYSSQFVTSAGSMLHPCGRERSEEAVGERAVSLSYKFVVNNLNQEDMSDNEKDFVERESRSASRSVSPQGSGKSASRSPAQSPALSKEGSRHSHSKSRSRSRSKSRSRSHRSSRRHYSRSRSRSHRRRSRSRSYSGEYRRRRSRSHTHSPMSNRRRHIGNRVGGLALSIQHRRMRREWGSICTTFGSMSHGICTHYAFCILRYLCHAFNSGSLFLYC
ncbi:transformer-2 protein homolog beta-like isoform X1 [Anguilla anguilla]|uniref:transformer-2 protein homolog beta-like isoform X1 n=2 Tax=Anguilla anguilla TaxID=7936 RepID=UPI0015B2FA4F|nr:transformer-2 protein homolog beta-like isoform X1 [Anguilla anguilla]